jgi:hypothetical protein
MAEHDHTDIFDRGLQFDLSTLIARRRLLGLFAGAGPSPRRLVVRAGRRAESDAPARHARPTRFRECVSAPPATRLARYRRRPRIPSRATAPTDPNVLTRSGIVRRDIRSSFGTSSTVAGGVPLTIELAVLDLADACAAADRRRRLLVALRPRGALLDVLIRRHERDLPARSAGGRAALGRCRSRASSPAATPGRWPHIHFEVYRSLASATSAGNRIATSQIALPQHAMRSRVRHGRLRRQHA